MYSTDTLQFEKLLRLVARHAQTPMGADYVLGLGPHSGRLQLERDLAAVAEAFALREEDVSWSFSGLEDPSDALALLKIRNSTLEPLVLRALARHLTLALQARGAIQPFRETAPTLWETVENLPPELAATADRINKKILPGGEIDDDASPELGRLRREINSQRGRLTRSLEEIMRKKGDAIQDEVVSIRNERFVIPVKADFTGQIGGVAHGTSSSGATVFIEPLEAIEANNELQKLKAREESEVARILSSLTDELREQSAAVEMAVEAIGELDLVRAKTVFAERFEAVVPEITENETLDLKDARHPLLEENLRTAENPKSQIQNPKSNIVPVSFSLTADEPVMIISGANAGGKTVVLKTAGLLSLMAVSGLPVPARQARIPFYASVLADIGDRQSLTANLSTFSSHISNIASMMENLHKPALVLLDEVGTGTDPEEGSALGVAVVDHFRDRGAQVIASTHYRGLKIYAANDPAVINASVEFDEKTLEPTYRLLTGLAGASSGLEIARRFGIGDEVIEAARENLDAAAQEAESYLQKLQEETRRAEDQRRALEDERRAVADRYASLDVDFHKKERERRAEFEKELERVLREFEKRTKEFLKSVTDKKERRKFEKAAAAETARLRRRAEETRRDSEFAPDAKKEQGRKAKARQRDEEIETLDEAVAVGAEVLLKNFGTTGRVEKLSGDEAEVLVGSMRMRQRTDDLQVIAAASGGGGRKAKAGRGGSRAKGTAGQRLDEELRAGGPETELNLIGRTTLEAEDEIDKFLDEAFVNGYPQVRIVHGHGTGALRNFVREFLKGHPHVEGFGTAPQNEGGNGATIVEMKR